MNRPDSGHADPLDERRTADDLSIGGNEDAIGGLNTSPVPDVTPSGRPLLGERWSDESPPRRNLLLAALPPESFARLRPLLTPVENVFKEVIWEKDEPMRYVYFPLSGVHSILNIMQDGSSVEVGTIGNEGMVGVPVVLGVARAPLYVFTQVPGISLRMRSEDLRDALNENMPLRDRLQRYTVALFSMLAQAAACNRTHSAHQRLARWVLMTHDRVGVDTFPLTHEFMAQMLGVRRATVTEEAGRLQAGGAITYERGIVTVVRRDLLEQSACECYWAMLREYENQLGSHGERPV